MKEYKVITQKYGHMIDRKLPQTSGSKIKYPMYSVYKWSYTTEKEKEDVLEKIVQILGDIIQECTIRSVLKQQLKEYPDLDFRDRKKIEALFIANQFIAKEEGVSYLSYYLIYLPIRHMLEDKEVLDIDGWTAFRTHKYRLVLKDLLQETVYNYLVQKEYLECIYLLTEHKTALKSQESLECIHILFDKDGKLKLLDKEMEDKTKEYKSIYCKDLGALSVSVGDLLLDLLIHASPKEIYIHQKERIPNPYFLDMLERVFEKEIKYCKGCPYCQIEEDDEKY